MAGLDSFSELLKQRAEEDDPVFNEEDLIGELIADIPGAEGIKSLKDLKAFLGISGQNQSKFKDMEKGHTQATQRLAQIEQALKGRGINDIDTFLGGGPAKPVDRKKKVQDFLRKNVEEKHVPFYEELLDLAAPEKDMSGMMGLMLSSLLAENLFLDQFGRDEKYKDLDDDTKGKLRKALRENPKAILDALDGGKNPLHGLYAQHFAETNPDVIQKKIEAKAQEKLEAEKGKHLETPGAGRAPARTETDTQKAQEERADHIKEQTGVDLRE